MANKFWARKSNKYTIISSAPSVNKTQVGNAVVPIPYPVTEKMGKAKDTATTVKLNGDDAYIHGSNSVSVKGDGPGKLGGVKSGTVEAKSEPIVGTASPTVKSHGQRIVREGDLQQMQGGNTIGKITCSESGSPAHITDDGAIEGETLPPDMDSNSANALYQESTSPSNNQNLPRATKPTASDSSGGLGATTGSPVVLYTGQLYYEYDFSELVLSGVFPIPMQLNYLSEQHYHGMFGINRRFAYEKQFRAISNKTYRLYLDNGREFDFVETDDGVIDTGNTGIEVSRYQRQINENKGEWQLRYVDSTSNTYHIEVYHHECLLRVNDSHGNGLSFDYSPNGTLHSIRNNSGSCLRFFYNTHRKVEYVKDHGGRQWHFQYEQGNNLSQITPPMGEVECYRYRVHPNPSQGHHALLADVTATIHSQSNSVDKGGVRLLLSADYDKAGRVTRYQEAQAQFDYIYHHQRLVEKVDQHNESVRYGLDEYGLISAIRYSDGRVIKEDYDPKKRTATVTVNNGDPRIETYDELYRLVSVTNGCCASCGHQVKYRYEGDNPNPVAVIDDGKKIVNRYDQHHKLLSTAAPNGTVDEYKYTPEGQVSSYTNASGQTTFNEYNDCHRLVQITNARGDRYQFAYDLLGRNTERTDPEQQTETLIYNTFDQVTSHSDALGVEVQFAYNPQQQLSGVVEPSGQHTHYQYDQYLRPIGQRQTDGSGKGYQYNAQGDVETIKREDGSESAFSYNQHHHITQVIARQQTDDSTPDNPQYNQESVGYQYDIDGDLIQAHLGEHAVVLGYDDEGRLINSTQHGIEVGRWYQHKGGLLAGIGLLDKQVNYHYDQADNVEVIQQGLQSIRQTFSPTGKLVQRDYPNRVQEIYVYDEADNLVQITATRTSTFETLLSIDYCFNKKGLVTQKSFNNVPTVYQYDSADRLTQAGDETFAYDSAGNVFDGYSGYSSQGNQLNQNADYIFSYDGRGNLIKKAHKHQATITLYDYNLFDQLTSVTTVDIQDETHYLNTRLSFRYDAFNRRVQKSTEVVNDGETILTTEYYLYDQFNLVGILDSNKQLIATITHSDEIDQPLSITTYGHEPLPLTPAEKTYFDSLSELDQQTILSSKTERVYYYHRDHLGSIIALSNHAGEIVEQFDYSAYGEVIRHSKTEETHNPFCYTGREFDTKDLYYYRARYYDPQTKRFLSKDPIGFVSGDTNLYRYVENNPVNFVDPLGFDKCKAIRRYKDRFYKKAIRPLAKVVAKQTAKLGVAAVPFLGWAMAAWTAYDLVQLGLRLDELWDEYSAIEEMLQKCIAGSKKVNTKKARESNRVREKRRKRIEAECGKRDQYRSLKNPKKHGTERDHIPSQALVKDRAKTLIGRNRKQLACVEKIISSDMETLALPKGVHRDKTSTTDPSQMSRSQRRAASNDLAGTVKKESREVTKFANKNMNPTDPCRKLIAEELAFFRTLTNEYFDEMIAMAVNECV